MSYVDLKMLVSKTIEMLEDEAPQKFFCPISCQAMRRPVRCSDGFVYEQHMIRKWCGEHDGEGPPSSPMTRAALHPKRVADDDLALEMKWWVTKRLGVEGADTATLEASMRAFLGEGADDVEGVDHAYAEDDRLRRENIIRNHVDGNGHPFEVDTDEEEDAAIREELASIDFQATADEDEDGAGPAADVPLVRVFASPPVDSDVQDANEANATEANEANEANATEANEANEANATEDSDEDSDADSDVNRWLSSRLPPAVVENRRKILAMLDRYDRAKRYNRRYQVEYIEHLKEHVHDPAYYKEEMQFGAILRMEIQFRAPWATEEWGVTVVPRGLFH